MGNNSSRQYTYQQYYNAVQTSGYDVDFKKIDVESLNPYEVLNVSKTFTWDELKDSYRKLALNTHPDKEGGNKDIFNIITHCFKKLAIEYKNRDADKQHSELKKQSAAFFDKISNNNIPHPSDVLKPSKDITNAMFNKNFEKCKVEDEDVDFGYGSIMEESSKVRDDINIKRLFKKDKLDTESFNEVFNKNVPVSKQVVKYKEPEPLLLAKTIQFTELGSKKPDDYTSSIEQTKKLGYTDYMRAHDGTRLIDPSLINGKHEFKSVAEYEKYRDSKIKKGLSSKERKMIEEKKIKEDREEFERLERLKKYDGRIEKAYEKANRLFLK